MPCGHDGSSFRYEIWEWSDGKERCESRGLRKPDGSVLRINDSMRGKTLYLGWRALWQPMPTTADRWIALFQLHISGPQSGEPSAGPYVLRTLGDGTLHFQYITPDGTSRHIWNTPLRTGAWQTFVIGFRVPRLRRLDTAVAQRREVDVFQRRHPVLGSHPDGPGGEGEVGRLPLRPSQRQRDSLAEPTTPGRHTR
jgi:hypothetical protein